MWPIQATTLRYHTLLDIFTTAWSKLDPQTVCFETVCFAFLRILVHLSRGGAEVQMYAPDVSQMHVIDHSKGQPAEESRNVLTESARIARGNITDLAKLSVTNHDAVIFPGGFGAAKNL